MTRRTRSHVRRATAVRGHRGCSRFPFARDTRRHWRASSAIVATRPRRACHTRLACAIRRGCARCLLTLARRARAPCRAGVGATAARSRECTARTRRARSALCCGPVAGRALRAAARTGARRPARLGPRVLRPSPGAEATGRSPRPQTDRPTDGPLPPRPPPLRRRARSDPAVPRPQARLERRKQQEPKGRPERIMSCPCRPRLHAGKRSACHRAPIEQRAGHPSVLHHALGNLFRWWFD